MELKDRLEFVLGTFINCNSAYTELLQIITCNNSATEVSISKGHTFRSYYYALQYTIVLEYCKLTEKYNSKYRLNNVGSLEGLMLNLPGWPESTENPDLNTRYLEIKGSLLSKTFRDLRDWKYAHIDGNGMVSAHKLESFTFTQIEALEDNLRSILNLLQDLVSIISPGSRWLAQVPNIEDRTQNFITFHAEYQDYIHSDLNRISQFMVWKNQKKPSIL